MDKYEDKARSLKQSGALCSNAIFDAFKDELKLEGKPPLPRSIDGKCGAILTTEYILKNINREKYIDEYNKLFLDKFKYDKCLDLMKNDRRCSDYVGLSSRYISEILNKED